jgi:hypothetical protein
MLDHQFEQSQGRVLQQKCFLVVAFLPYLALALDYPLAALVLSGYIAALAIVGSIYCWGHQRDIRYLIMAFFVSVLPLALVSLFFILLFFFGSGL